MGLNWLTAVVSALVLSSVNAAPAGNKTSSKASPTNRDFIPMPVGNDFLPDSYSPCAEEGDSCSCNGLVILGTPELNHWSEPAVADSTVNCVSSSFPNTLSDPGHSRQCWCKPRSLANSEDYMNSVPKLSPAYTTVTPGLKWWAANDVQMFGSPQTFDVLSVDTSVRKVTISHIEGSLLTTPQLGQAVNALAAVNGGFHAYGTNVGTITKLRVNGVDVVTENTVTKWDLQNEDVEGVLTIDGSGKVDIVTSLDTSAWVNDYTFLHSGPLLLLNGVRQPLDGKNWNHVRNPRTVVCTGSGNTVFLVTVDGRYPTSAGMTLAELQLFLQGVGCRSAINMDGGGSTTMYIQSEETAYPNGVVNEPRDKPPPGVAGFNEQTTLRGVSTAIAVL